MARALDCDLCHGLQPGEPIVTHEMKGTDPDQPQRVSKEEWCNECMRSFAEWKAERIMLGEHRLQVERSADPDRYA